MAIPWARIIFGIVAGLLFSILGLGVIIGMVIAFSPAQTIADVQAIATFSAVMKVMLGVGSAWGAFLALRPVRRSHLVAGLLIGLGLGVLGSALISGPAVGTLLTLALTLLAGFIGARLAQLNPRRRDPNHQR
ncbi:MAG: hypothetical protein D6775_07285 [Caldilineae bacterium]|nr:MAG: hypothetical protein D6775_07285 [Caldilineae bacterium]